MKDIVAPTEVIKQEFVLHKRIALIFALIAANIVLFSYTSPFTSAALLVFAGYFLVSLDILLIVGYLLQLLYVLVPNLRTVHRRLLISIVSFCMILLALLSIGQLTLRDLIVVTVIWVVGYAYSLRVRPLFK